jgi:hypothetical protein
LIQIFQRIKELQQCANNIYLCCEKQSHVACECSKKHNH